MSFDVEVTQNLVLDGTARLNLNTKSAKRQRIERGRFGVVHMVHQRVLAKSAESVAIVHPRLSFRENCQESNRIARLGDVQL